VSRHYIRLEVSDGPSTELALGAGALVAACARALHHGGVLLEGIEYIGPAAEPPREVHEVTGSDSASAEVT